MLLCNFPAFSFHRQSGFSGKVSITCPIMLSIIKILLVLIVAASFAACDKGNVAGNPCSTGTIRVNNYASDPYTVYIDGSMMGVLQSHSTSDYTVNTGTHSIRVVQLTGYLYSPDERTGGTVIEGCDTDIFTFP